MVEKRKSEGTDKVYPIFAKRSKANLQDTSNAVEDEENNSIDATARLLSFQELLDFSSINSQEEISARFDQIAKALLHELRIVVKPQNSQEIQFQVVEAEFYLQFEDLHEDPFTHGSEEQKISGRWYFHRAPRFSQDSHRSLTSTTEYRGGSRKGMDLTFGGPRTIPLSSAESSASNQASQTEEKRIRGGILLRSIREVKGNKIISGPSLLVDRILEASNASGIEELVQEKWGRNISAFPSSASALDGDASTTTQRATSLYLKPVKVDKNPPPIYFSPRIGLELSHPGTTGSTVLPLHPRIQYLPKRYRFFTNPQLLTAKGRPQTFLGVLEGCMSSQSGGLQKSGLSNQVACLTGSKESTSAKYLADYISGRNEGARFLDSVVGPNGKGASSSVVTYLKMMGAISILDM